MFFQKDVGLNTWFGSYFTLTIFSIFTLIILPLQHYLRGICMTMCLTFPLQFMQNFIWLK